MNTVATRPSVSKSRVYAWLGYAVSAACLIWVFYDFHVRQALEELANVSWRWVVAGIALDVLSYVVQGVRWKFLLTPFGHAKTKNAIRAVFVGLFANLLFPLRPGEPLRAFLVAKSEDLGFATVFGSVLVERLIDLVVTTAALAMMSLFVPLPEPFRRIADALGIVTLAVLGLFIALILYIEFRFAGDPRRMHGGRRVPGKLMSALLGLHAMGTSPSFYPAVFTSLLMPFCQMLALWAMMRAYRIIPGLPFIAAVVVLLIINLGVSLPNAPANVGSYQLFCVLGLSIFIALDRNTEKSFSFFAWWWLTLPVALLGLYASLRSGLSLHSIREQVSRLPSETNPERANP